MSSKNRNLPQSASEPEPAPPKKIGRPSLYKPEYCQMLIDHMAQGYPFETFAAQLGTHRYTLYRWVDEHPAFSDAKKIGTEKSLGYMLDMGRKLATGEVQGNTAAWIFMMKNMHKWRDKHDVEVTGQVDLKHVAIANHAQLKEALAKDPFSSEEAIEVPFERKSEEKAE